MPYTKKLPSGNWCCQFRLAGKTKTVTASTKREALLKAAELQMQQERKERTGLTVREAVEQYIASRDGILSPSTIQGYQKILDYYLGEISDRPLKLLDPQEYQAFVNGLAKKKTYKGKPFSRYKQNLHALTSRCGHAALHRPAVPPCPSVPSLC